MRRRQQRDLELAEQRRLTISRHHSKQKSKSERVALIRSDIIFTAESDPNRLTNGTSASKAAQLTSVDLEEAEYRRMTATAHSRQIPLTGRDLKYSHRAIPIWIRPIKG
jgi:hypothetical protein